MSNTGEFYDHTTWPASGSAGSSASARQELDLIEAGFNKLPPLAGQANKLIKVGAGAVDMTTSLITDDGTTVTVNGILALTSGLAFPPGTAALPSIAAAGDVDTGMWFPAANNVAFSAGGAEILRVNVAGINVPLGSAPVPSVRPVGSGDTGLWFPSTTTVAASVSGVEVLRLTAAGAAVTGGMSVTSSLAVGSAGSGSLILQAGSASVPSILPTGDTNTGVFFPSADTIGLATGGVERMRIDSIVKFAAQPTLTSGDAIYKPLADDLASTASGKGAAILGSEDAGGYFTGANAEAIFQELGNPFGAYSSGIHIFRYIPPAQWASIFDGTNTTDNTPHLISAATAARLSSTDTTGRTRSVAVYLPGGIYNISTAAGLAPANGCSGLTVYGSGRGATVLQFTAAGSTISVASSIYTTFRDLTFRSSVGIDTDQTAFTIAQTGNPLRSWRFERCAFEAFYRCFTVTGTSMCSEFSFEQCGFAQCYTLMHNSNDQAVNWTFSDCHWENGSMITSKDKNLAAAFHLTRGTFVDWRGGSMIFLGKLVYFNLTASGVFSRTSHKLHFEGLRVELEDDGAGAHTPWIDRVSSGYVSGSNSPAVTFENATILNRGSIATSTIYAQLWANCKFTFRDIETEGGVVSGILDSVTAASAATLILDRARGITYAENTAARVNSHDQHYVEIVPDVTAAATTPRVSMRLASLSVPACAEAKTLYVRGPTGSIPQGGTTVNLPLLPDHTSVLRIFMSRYAAALQTLQVDLKDQADTTVYATITALAADRFKEDSANAKEIGAQIPSGTPLMLKFTGTPEVVKGVVGLEYL